MDQLSFGIVYAYHAGSMCAKAEVQLDEAIGERRKREGLFGLGADVRN